MTTQFSSNIFKTKKKYYNNFRRCTNMKWAEEVFRNFQYNLKTVGHFILQNKTNETDKMALTYLT